MYHAKKSFFVAVLVSCLLGTGVGHGQTGPIGGQPPNPNPNPTPGATALNDTSFPQMLQALGYKVDTKKNTQNQNYWVVTTQKDGWGYVVDIMPTRNQGGQIIGFWFISDLGNAFPNPATLNPTAVVKMMEKSHQIAPYFFSYNPVTKHFAMNYEYPSGSIAQANLEREFNQLFTKIKDTYTLWDPKNLQVAGGPGPVVVPPQPPVPQPNGGGNLVETTWNGSETLQGFGKLTFKLGAGGKATMIDSAGVSQGTWQQNGNQVKVQFFNGQVTYSGTLNGNQLSGSAVNNAGANWTFTLTKQ